MRPQFPLLQDAGREYIPRQEENGMNALEASVIVPARNAARTLGPCLESLLAQKAPGKTFEIIVVDDGSVDDTAAVARRYPVLCLSQPRMGPAGARNVGVRNARGGIVLFIDADCQAAPDWLVQMLKPFADPSVSGAKGSYRTRQREWVARVVQAEYEGKYRYMRKSRQVDFIDTYSAGFRKDIFSWAGGYDTSFPYPSVEDQEFSFRLARAGCRMVFNPDAVVYHLHADSLGTYFRKKFRIGYWKVRVLRRHPGKLWRDSHTPQILKAEMVLAMTAVSCGMLALFAGSRELAACGAALFTAFALLAAIEMKNLLRTSPLIGLSAIFVLLLRSLALGSGLIYGLRKI
jgi:glycosyltransferase involved in cell wall biosynthesis